MKLKWFAGGNERAKQAVEIISDLLDDLDNNSQNEAFKNVLFKYKHELQKKGSSVPFILSRMNVEISNVTVSKRITLTDYQLDKLKQIAALSYVRYGY